MKLSITRGPAGKRRRFPRGRSEKGFVLIEVLIAIAIFGVVSVGFLSALVTGYRGVIVAHEQRTAHTLTRTTLENVSKAQFPITDYGLDDGNFHIAVHADYVDKDHEVIAGSSSLQMITVTISCLDSGRSVLVTQALKVKSS